MLCVSSSDCRPTSYAISQTVKIRCRPNWCVIKATELNSWLEKKTKNPQWQSNREMRGAVAHCGTFSDIRGILQHLTENKENKHDRRQH